MSQRVLERFLVRLGALSPDFSIAWDGLDEQIRRRALRQVEDSREELDQFLTLVNYFPDSAHRMSLREEIYHEKRLHEIAREQDRKAHEADRLAKLIAANASLKVQACEGYWIGDQFLKVAKQRGFEEEARVTIVGATVASWMALVFRVVWKGEIWWLKLGPDVGYRKKAIQTSWQGQSPSWEAMLQVERDMFFRSQLSAVGSCASDAYPVLVEGFDRPAMIVKDAGDAVERRLFCSSMTRDQVLDMSQQLYNVLQAAGKQGVVHGDVSLRNICCKDGKYSLIDWGLACGRGLEVFLSLVQKAWPGLVSVIPDIPDLEMSPSCFFYLCARPDNVVDDMESLLYCCFKLLNGNTLPWSQAALSGDEEGVLRIRQQTVPPFIARCKSDGSVCKDFLLPVSELYRNKPS